MKPINKTKISNCPEGIYTSNCVTWTGPDIPCIDLCNGDSVSNVVFKVAEKICELYTDYESLKDLNYQCLIEELSVTTPSNITFKTLFQLLIDNDCKLKDLIDAINITAQENAGISLAGLDLKCLAPEFVSCEDCNPEDVVSVLQKLINKICEHETRITKTESDILNLDIRLQTVEDRTDPLGPIVEAEINTCLNPSPNTKATVSNHLQTFTDPAICALRASLGTDAELLSAYSNICPDDFNGKPGFFSTPTKVSEAMSSLFVMVCEIYQKQLDCCKTTCGKIKVGFGTTYNATTKILTLNFNGTYGNDIPNDLGDCGTTVTITDINNITATTTFTLEDVVSVDLDLSALDTTNFLNVSVKYCLSNDEITCQDCIGKVIEKLTDPSTSTCKVCRYCVTGPDGEYALLAYTLNGVPKTTQIETGECITFKLPDEQVVISSIIYSNTGVNFVKDSQFSCEDITLPTPVEAKCYFFPIPGRDVSQSIDIDFIAPGTYKFDSDYRSSIFDQTRNVANYVSLTFNNTTYPITGETTSVFPGTPGSKDFAATEDTFDSIGTTAKIPLNLPAIVTNQTTCGSIAYSFSNGDGSVNGPGAVLPNLTWVIDKFGRHGIMLKMPTVQIPEIELVDVLTNNKMYVKGEELSTCSCPL